MNDQSITISAPRELSRDLAQMSETAAFMQMIERVALSPNVNVDVIRQLLDMQDRVADRSAKSAFDAAFAIMQPKLPTITQLGGIKDRAGNIQSTFAKWEDINEAVRPILGAHGFYLRHRIAQSETRVIVTGVLGHESGHREEAELNLPIDATGNKNAVQAIGSSVSYGQRYTAKALLNIASRAPVDRNADDDGKAAGNGDMLSEDQLETIQRLIVETNSDIGRFCKFMGVAKLADIQASEFRRAAEKLMQKKARAS